MQRLSGVQGTSWCGLRNSGILASTCCGSLERLSDGRIALLWNRPEEGKLYNRHTRAELAIAFSDDECWSWSKPVVLSHRPLQEGEKYSMSRQSYPYLYEREPGLFWVTTMQGGLRMSIRAADIAAGPDPARLVRPTTVVCLGSSTTARRTGVKKVFEQRLGEALPDMRIVNSGVPGDTTERARKRFDEDVLAHQPDVVIIQLGGNDAAIDVWNGKTEPRVSVERYRENLVYFITSLKKIGAQVILTTPGMFRWTSTLKELYGKPPYNPDVPDGFCFKLREYSAVVRDIAAAENVFLVDIFKAHEDYDRVDGRSIDEIFLDGMHPNDVGHALVAEKLMPVVRAAASK